MRRAYSLEKTLMLGKTEGKRKRGLQRMRWSDSTDVNLSKLWEIVEDREAWRAAVPGFAESDLATERQPQQGQVSNISEIGLELQGESQR